MVWVGISICAKGKVEQADEAHIHILGLDLTKNVKESKLEHMIQVQYCI